METWGLCVGPAWASSISELTGPASMAERAGFDRITTGEYRNDSLMWLALLAAATSDVPVATTITNIALRHPSVVGEGVAALRDSYGDRIELGVGVSHPSLVAADLALHQPGLDDLESYVAAVRAVAQGRPYESPHYRVAGHNRRRIEPGQAPVHVAVLGARAARQAARYADGLVLTWTPPSWTNRLAGLARADRPGERRPEIRVVLPTLLSDDPSEARVACARSLMPYLKLPSYRRMLKAAAPDPTRIDAIADGDHTPREAAEILGKGFLHDIAALGGAGMVRDAIDRNAEAGADVVVLYPLDSGQGWRQAVNDVIRYVAPGA